MESKPINPHVEHLSDHNYEEVLDRSYIDVTNKAIKATVIVDEVVDVDFMQASENFWLKYEGGKYYNTYKEGVMSGTFNNRQPNFRAVTETLNEAFKNIIRIECEREDKTVGDFTPYINMVKLSFELLANKIDDTLDDGLSGYILMAYVNAVINSFVDTNIR